MSVDEGSVFAGKAVLVTGGTGSFGRAFVRAALGQPDLRKLIVFSRDELKQSEMQAELGGDPRLRFFLGDVRDRDRLYRAFDEVDYVVHAAAQKQIPAAEYNPFEAVKTNIVGAQNIIDAAIDRRVERVVALSTDKASSPVNLYGATKLVSDKLFVSGNAYVGPHQTLFSVVRYGNVLGSRGSIVPLFRKAAASGQLPITDERMTRFWITLDGAVALVMRALSEMVGGEIFVPKIPSMKITDMADVLAPDAQRVVIGIRPGEKLHEEMISVHDARRTRDCDTHYVILPDIDLRQAKDAQAQDRGTPVPDDFQYSSDRNDRWLTASDLRDLLGA